MKPEIIAMWVDALRSGKYPQTQSTLCDGTGYCCLGVLCDLYIKSNPEANSLWAECHPGTPAFFWEDEKVGWNWERNYLPEPVMKWIGSDIRDPLVHGPAGFGRWATLSRLNDNSLSFSEIADVIEKSL